MDSLNKIRIVSFIFCVIPFFQKDSSSIHRRDMNKIISNKLKEFRITKYGNYDLGDIEMYGIISIAALNILYSKNG